LGLPALTVYRTKRDFSKTPEPAGQHRVAPSARLRFVVQKHAARHLHYDLRLEWDGVFKSWAVTRGPSLDPADKRLAIEVEDHPLDYGDFEGTIPKGEYGGGTVQLWDRGYWSPEGGKSRDAAFKSGDLKFTLDGSRLHGGWVLVRMRGDRYGSKKNHWLLIKHRDASAKPADADSLLTEDRSVASGRTMQEIADGVGSGPKPFMLATLKRARADAVWSGTDPIKMRATRVRSRPKTARGARVKPIIVRQVPQFVEPQLCTLVDRPPQNPGWAHEVKFDGYRAQLSVQRGRAVIRTRTGLDWTDRFAAIARDASALPDCVIDGEVVALDQRGLPSFAALQAALSAEKSEDLVFFAFDLLFEGREDLRTLPLMARKGRLEKLLAAGRGGALLCAQNGTRGHRVEGTRCALPLGPLRQLDQGQMPRGTRSGPGRLDHGTRHPALAARRRAPGWPLDLRGAHRHRVWARGGESAVAPPAKIDAREKPVCRRQRTAQGA
jgi:bifunctional non-homologous end joining protein LigD